MLEDVREALAAEILDCKPIMGHDYPLTEGAGQNNRNRIGLGGAELVEVLHMDGFQAALDPHPQKAKLSDDQILLQMLLPT